MGISDWFKKFKRNAAALEEYREGVAQPEGGESEASRAPHPPAQAPRDGNEHRPDPPR
jgi:hypothetical protein